MAVTTTVSPDGDAVRIAITGSFDFGIHEEFRAAYRHERPDAQYTVDLVRTEYLDSAALGMILVLRKHAGEDRARVQIVNANASVKRVLQIARFDRLFDIPA